MVEYVEELIVRHLHLIYKTDIRTKWLVELQMPGAQDAVTIYLTRPACETKQNLLSVIHRYQDLNTLFKQDCSALK